MNDYTEETEEESDAGIDTLHKIGGYDPHVQRYFHGFKVINHVGDPPDHNCRESKCSNSICIVGDNVYFTGESQNVIEGDSKEKAGAHDTLAKYSKQFDLDAEETFLNNLEVGLELDRNRRPWPSGTAGAEAGKACKAPITAGMTDPELQETRERMSELLGWAMSRVNWMTLRDCKTIVQSLELVRGK